MDNKNYYITTPIYYPSGKPHMGHAYSSIVADVFARFKRLDGYNVFFLTGTDEHGLKIQKSAEKNNKKPKEFCDNISKIFENLTKSLNLSNDDFIRTTEERHRKAVQFLWERLQSKGYIYLSKYKGWYSISDEAYYNEDEIAEKDGKKISTVSGSLVDWVEEESFFFKLSSLQDKLLEFYNNNPKFILPISRKNEVISFVKSGLKDLSVSRKSFSWGIKVPNDKKHIIYVWLDALTNYISALNYPNLEGKLFKNFWPATLHIIGKDILRFHAIYWPAFLLAADIKPPNRVYGHGWILSDKEKMSKSKGNILDPLELIKIYGLDQLRYYLVKEVSLGNDGNISHKNIENCINSDLANNYGNFCQRTFSFVEKNCKNIVPVDIDFNSEDLKILNSFNKNIDKIRSLMDNQRLNEYVKFIIDKSSNANKYFNDEAPWNKKDDKNRLNTIVYVSLEIIRKISILLLPIIPYSANKALMSLNLNAKTLKLSSITNHLINKPGTKIINQGILFQKTEKNND
jgi:methionyl-tRNA synthetase